jgi:hypothetical protein
VGEAAHGLEDARKAGPACIGAGLAEAREAQHDEARVAGMQGGQVQSPAVQRAGAEVLHQHVEIRYQPQEQRAAFLLAHIQ